MAETTTVNYGWTKPDPGGSPNTWGTTLNATTDKVDAKVYANEQGLVPIGAVTMYAGAAAPANWLLCNGATLSRAAPYDKLFAVVGTAFNVGTVAADKFMLPNLTQRFPLGAPPGGVGATGGSFSVALATANLPAHAHPITDVTHNHTDPGHTHTASQDAHQHSVTIIGATSTTGVQTGGGPTVGIAGAVTYGTTIQQPNVSVDPHGVGLAASGTNLTTTQAVGSGTAFNVIPQYAAINFMVKYQ